MTNSTQLVPATQDAIVSFGKYKGHPLGVMMADPGYTGWLMAQPGVESKWPAIIAAIRNGATPVEQDITPEHNAMQLRFLDEDLALRALHNISGPKGRASAPIKYPDGSNDAKIIFEQDNWDVSIAEGRTYKVPQIKVDNEFTVSACIELKPQIGDDYPAILRKVMSRRPSETGSQGCKYYRKAVITDYFESRVATWKQVKQLFIRSGVVLLNWEEATRALPNSELYLPKDPQKEEPKVSAAEPVAVDIEPVRTGPWGWES